MTNKTLNKAKVKTNTMNNRFSLFTLIFVLLLFVGGMNAHVYGLVKTEFPSTGSYHCTEYFDLDGKDWKLHPKPMTATVNQREACDIYTDACTRVICRDISVFPDYCTSGDCNVKTRGISATELFGIMPELMGTQSDVLMSSFSTYATFENVDLTNYVYDGRASSVNEFSDITVDGIHGSVASVFYIDNAIVGPDESIFTDTSKVRELKNSQFNNNVLVTQAAAFEDVRNVSFDNLTLEQGASVNMIDSSINSLKVRMNDPEANLIVKDFKVGDRSSGAIYPATFALVETGDTAESDRRGGIVAYFNDTIVNDVIEIEASGSGSINVVENSKLPKFVSGSDTVNYVLGDVYIDNLKVKDTSKVLFSDRMDSVIASITGESKVDIPSDDDTYTIINKLTVGSTANGAEIKGSVELSSVTFESTTQGTVKRSFPVQVYREKRSLDEGASTVTLTDAYVRVRDKNGNVVWGCESEEAKTDPTCPQTGQSGLTEIGPISFDNATQKDYYTLEIEKGATLHQTNLNLEQDTAPVWDIIIPLPEAPNNVTASVPSNTDDTDTIVLQWQDNSDIEEKWYIKYQTGSLSAVGTERVTKINSTNRNGGGTVTYNLDLADAQPNTKVEICIQAWGQSGATDECVKATNTLTSNTFIYTRALAPQLPSLDNEERSMKAKWSGSDGKRTNPISVMYNANIHKCGESDTIEEKNIPENGLSLANNVEFLNLVPNTCYDVGITSENSDGVKSSEEKLDEYTLAVLPNLLRSTPSIGSIYLEWDNGTDAEGAGNPDYTKYEIWQKVTEQAKVPITGHNHYQATDQKETLVDTVNTTSVTITEINGEPVECGTYYAFTVIAKNENGEKTSDHNGLADHTISQVQNSTSGDTGSQPHHASERFDIGVIACIDHFRYEFTQESSSSVNKNSDRLTYCTSGTDCSKAGREKGCWIVPGSGTEDNYEVKCNVPKEDDNDGNWYLHLLPQNANGLPIETSSIEHIGPYLVDTIDPTTKIKSPSAGTTNYYSDPVKIDVNDTDNRDLDTCLYDTTVDITDIGTAKTRDCNTVFEVTAGPGKECSQEGTSACTINVRSNDTVGNKNGDSITLNIDVQGPDTTDNADNIVTYNTDITNVDGWFANNPKVSLQCDDRTEDGSNLDVAGCSKIYYCTVDVFREGENATCDPMVDGNHINVSGKVASTDVRFDCPADRHCKMKMKYQSVDAAIPGNPGEVKTLGNDLAVLIDRYVPSAEMESLTFEATESEVRFNAVAKEVSDTDPEGYNGSGIEYYIFEVEEEDDLQPDTSKERDNTLTKKTKSNIRLDVAVKHNDKVGHIGDLSSKINNVSMTLKTPTLVVAESSSELKVKLGNNGNPSKTQYAISTSACDNCYIDTSGSLVNIPVYENRSTWNQDGGVTVSNLQPNTEYTFSSVSKNTKNVLTNGASKTLATFANIPIGPDNGNIAIDDTVEGEVSLTWNANGNPDYTDYQIQRRASCLLCGDNENWENVTKVNGTSYTDRPPGSSDQSYQYRLNGINVDDVPTDHIFGEVERPMKWVITQLKDWESGVNYIETLPGQEGKGVRQTGFSDHPNVMTCEDQSGDCGNGAIKLKDTCTSATGICEGKAYYALEPISLGTNEIEFNNFNSHSVENGGTIDIVCRVMRANKLFSPQYTISDPVDCDSGLTDSSSLQGKILLLEVTLTQQTDLTGNLVSPSPVLQLMSVDIND